MSKDFAFSKDGGMMSKRKSFMESLFELKHTDLQNGYLKKLNTKGRWQERWFVVHGHYLSYFWKHIETAQHFDMIPSPAGTINLWHVTDAILDDNKIILEFDDQKDLRGQRIKTKAYVLKAQDNVAAQQWINAMQKVPLQAKGAPAWAAAEQQQHQQDESNQDQLSEATRAASEMFVIHSIQANIANNNTNQQASGTMETLISNAHELLIGGRPTRLFLKKVAPGCEVRVNLALEKDPHTIAGFGEFLFPEPETTRDGRPVTHGQMTIEVTPVSNGDASVSQCIVVMDWSLVDNISVRDFAKRQSSSATPSVSSTPHPQSKKMFLAHLLLRICALVAVYGLLLVLAFEYLGSSSPLLSGLAVNTTCWFIGLSTPTMLFESSHEPNSDDDLHLSRFMIRRMYVVDKCFNAISRGYSSSFNRDSGDRSVDDVSITDFERKMIKELRRRLRDVFEEDIDKTKALVGDKKLKPLYVPKVLFQDPNEMVTIRKLVCEKHLNHDFRLVRFLRARDMNIDKAERMVRRSLDWRMSFSADTIVENFMPSSWLMDYAVPPELLELFHNDEDRRSWYLRDLEGHLTMFLRTGPLDWKGVYEKMEKDDDMLMCLGVWCLELLRQDLDKLHKDTNGEVPSYATLVFDLQGFSMKLQIPINRAVKIARKYFDIIATAYPELLHRVVIVNAPWLFNSLWYTFCPLLPKEMVEKISIHGHENILSHLLKVCSTDNIPSYLGGTLTIDGDPYCSSKLPPVGPYLPDNGQALLS